MRSRQSKALLLLLPILLALLAVPLLALAAANDFEISGAEVYSSYIEDDDWLIVVKYKNTLEPYYGNDTSQNAFLLQLTHANNTLIAQTPLPAWGYRPSSIYLSAATVASLEWGTAYKVKMNGTANETEYNLTAGNWRGDIGVALDDWCLALATSMESYDNATYLTATTAKGLVLNEEGGILFIIGIPYLDSIRPNIFQVVTSDIPYDEPTWTSAYWDTLDPWYTAVGPQLSGILNTTGDLISVDGKNIGMLLVFIAYGAIATAAFAIGHGTAGMALALPILVLGVYFGFIPFAVMGVGIAIVVVLLIRELVWSKT